MATGDPKPTDVLVVGAGAIGLACAWRAAREGLSVRVLERDTPGSGASGVAAGMLAPVGEATWGEERLLAAALASHRRWPAFAEELAAASGIETSHQPIGALHVALDRDEAGELRRRHDLMLSHDLEARWLSAAECRDLEPGLSRGVVGGVHAPHESGVDPAALVEALRVACRRAGVDLRSNTPVREIVSESGAVVGAVVGSGERFEATNTVLAAGAWSATIPGLPKNAIPPVRPVKGQILTLRGSVDRPVSTRIVVSERVYLVPRSDGRLIVGASVEEMGFDQRVTAGTVHELLREAYRTMPDVAEFELERAVAGLRPGTPDNGPLVGRSDVEGLVLATGHYRNGILLCPLTGDAVAAALNGVDGPPELAAAADPGRFASTGEVVAG